MENRIQPYAELYQAQFKWLRDCLNRNKSCVFGVQHGFEEVNTINEYQRRVPLSDYEAFRSKILEIENGACNILFSQDVVAFEKTSGTSTGNKWVLYTESSLKDFRRAIVPWLKRVCDQYDLTNGYVYWPLSPATRKQQYTQKKIPLGLQDTEYLGPEIHSFFTLMPAVPDWVGRIKSVNKWQLYTLYWLILRHDLKLVSVWSPTFFSVLLEAIDTYGDQILALYREGGSYKNHLLCSDYKAYERLQLFLKEKCTAILWPQLKLVSCWGDSSSSSFFQQLKNRLSQAHFEPKGLLLTEAVITVPDKDGLPVLASSSGFFEFICAGKTYLANELQVNTAYEVVVTTSGGLYRYRTQDLVSCENYVDGLPVLRFIGRSGIQSDLVGEKLSDASVSSCLNSLPGFHLLSPQVEGIPRYLLVVDTTNVESDVKLQQKLEQCLMKNVQYAYATKMGQLNRLEVYRLDNALEKYIDCMMQQGLQFGDIKMPVLTTNENWLNLIKRHKK